MRNTKITKQVTNDACGAVKGYPDHRLPVSDPDRDGPDSLLEAQITGSSVSSQLPGFTRHAILIHGSSTGGDYSAH